MLADLEGQGRPPFIGKWEGELGAQMDDQQVVKVMGGGHEYVTDILKKKKNNRNEL